ncbi:MAG: hypothetical protein K2N35_00965 [Muribaculaceae bacterium]|nr:hypothetical protein [Muribaculaceae bacterium]
MKKFLLSVAATALTASAFAATGDVKVIVDQNFKAQDGQSVVLKNPSNGTYMWGEDIQGMIQENGVYMTNDNNADNNYANRDFLTFKTAQGKATRELNISYNLFNPKGFGQSPAYYEINYYNNKQKFVFGIKESIGNWDYKVSIVTANEDGTTTETQLPNTHVTQNAVSPVEYNVLFSGHQAIVDIDGGSYAAYTATEGIQFIKLAVSGDKDWSRGMYIQNYMLSTTEVEAVETAQYTLKYVAGDQVLKEIVKSGVVGDPIVINDSEEAPIWNEDNTEKYLYVSNDAEGKTVDAEGTTVVTLTYRAAEVWNYTVGNNVNNAVVEGTCIEGESVTVPYSRYILASDGMVWLKEATDKQYNFSFTPDQNDYVADLVYGETDMTDGVYFVEAEDVEGLTEVTDGNANIRCSNAAAGYNAEGAEIPVQICKLSAGTYKVAIAGWGGAGTDLIVKAGENTVLTVTTTGSWAPGTSEEFELTEETAITFEGATKSRPVDFFLITGTGSVVGDSSAVEAVESANADGKWYNLQGVQVAAPKAAGLYIHNGKKIIVK